MELLVVALGYLEGALYGLDFSIEAIDVQLSSHSVGKIPRKIAL